MNIGSRPIITENDTNCHYEVHMLDFDKIIYSQIIKFEVCYFIREEKKFNNIEELVQQIRRDINFVKQVFKGS